MALKAQYAIVAEHVREGVEGKFDALGLFDRIFAAAVPAAHGSLVFTALLVADSEDDLGKRKIRLFCKAPNGAILFENSGDLVIKPVAGTWFATARVVVQIQGMPLPSYGRYTFGLE